MLTAKMGGGGYHCIIAGGVVGEQEASWLLLSILSLYINTTLKGCDVL